MEVEQDNGQVMIGYYPFRAKAQVLRLICEYLGLSYSDWFFNPDQWSRFRDNDAKTWAVKDLPFLKHGDFVVTGVSPMITYVCELANRPDLLGITLKDKTKIDNFRNKGDLKDTILGLLCSMRPSNSQEKLDRKRKLVEFYERKIADQMLYHEEECTPNSFYFGYLTILDFHIYEIVNYFTLLFLTEIVKFTKLRQIRDRVAALPEIKKYEESAHVVS